MNQEQKKPQLTLEEKKALRKQRWLKKRAWLNARTSLLSLLVLVPVYVLVILFLLVFPRSTVSQIEKRELATFPDFTLSSYLSGEYTADIATYFNDTVPFRDSFKRLGTQLTGLMGVQGTDDTVTLIQTDIVADNLAGDAGEEESSVAEETTPAVTATPVPSEEPDKDYTKEEAEFDNANGLLIVKQDGHYKVLPLFGGGSDDNYVNALNTMHEKLGDDVTIYSMPAPLSSEFYLPSNASEYSASQSERFDQIAEKLDSDIISINLCPVLAAHSEEPIYCRTDHHWQPLGAYYAIEEFASVAGVPFADLSEYEHGVNEGFVGSMYAYTDDSRVLNDPEDFNYYVPQCDYEAHYYDSYFNYLYTDDLFVDVDTANSYLMFMGSDTFIVKVDTAVKNGRTLLVLKDSYGNAEIPFLTSSFEHIFVVDVRYFNRNLINFIKEMGVTDVLFSVCSYSVVGVNANGLAALMTQDPDSEIVDQQLPSSEADPVESADPADGTAETQEDSALEESGTAPDSQNVQPGEDENTA